MGGGGSYFYNLDKEAVHEKIAQKGPGSLRKSGVSELFYQFFFRKACFHYYWNTFFLFLSGKYSCLL